MIATYRMIATFRGPGPHQGARVPTRCVKHHLNIKAECSLFKGSTLSTIEILNFFVQKKSESHLSLSNGFQSLCAGPESLGTS